MRALELRPQLRVASTAWLSPSLRLRTNRLGMYLTASSGSLRLMVSSICLALMLKDSCGSWNRVTAAGGPSEALLAWSGETATGTKRRCAGAGAGFCARRVAAAAVLTFGLRTGLASCVCGASTVTGGRACDLS